MTNAITYLTVADVANRLRASRKTILRRIRAKRLPAISEGRRHLIDPRDLEAYLEHLRAPQLVDADRATVSATVPDGPKGVPRSA